MGPMAQWQSVGLRLALFHPVIQRSSVRPRVGPVIIFQIIFQAKLPTGSSDAHGGIPLIKILYQDLYTKRLE